MPRKRKPLAILLLDAPWWTSAVLAAISYICFGVVLPHACAHDACGPWSPIVVGPASTLLAPLITSGFVLTALIAFCRSFFRTRNYRQLLDRQSGIDSIRLLDWKEFENLLGEYYRRKGYRVRENTRGGADGGVDLWLEQEGELYLIQCKQWRSQRVGVEIVRELYGVMAAERAVGGSVVTSGSFTANAEAFAVGKSIELIGGNTLANMIAEVQSAHGASASETEGATKNQERMCPRCGVPLVLRKASRGKYAGREFYGCSSYPKCRYIEN